MKTYMFPGQGSQFKGMCQDLLHDFQTLSDVASDILGYSIVDLCLNDPEKKLKQTEFTQPALFVVNALSYLKHYETTSEKSDFLIGHSLGEFNALFAAGVFDFETGLKLVRKRGELMSQSSAGAMAAVLGGSVDVINKILEDNSLDKIDIANINSPEQIVVSGDKAQIMKAAEFFDAHKVRYIPLQVSAAFHSRFMLAARSEFEEYLKGFTFKAPKIPVISNVQAEPYSRDNIATNLAQQITSSVRWVDSIRYLMRKGCAEYTELGPGEVLSKLVKSIESHENSLQAA